MWAHSGGPSRALLTVGLLTLLGVFTVVLQRPKLSPQGTPVNLETLRETICRPTSARTPANPQPIGVANDAAESTKIYVITPTTHTHKAQKADMTRMSQTLQLVPNLHWIVVEDAKNTSKKIADLLHRSNLPYTHLAVSRKTMNISVLKGRGMAQRNAGMDWIRRQYEGTPISSVKDVFYFGDDDNTYDVRLFNQYIRRVETIGVWAVGFPSTTHVETPIVSADKKKVIGWDVIYNPKRVFATDMAGFALSVQYLLKYPSARFHEGCKVGNFEPCFLEQLGDLKRADLVPFGFEGNKYKDWEILVWHTKTKQNTMTLSGGTKGFSV